MSHATPGQPRRDEMSPSAPSALLAEVRAVAAEEADPEQLLERIRDLLDADEATRSEPCDAEIWSWDRFSVNAVDPYWIRCTRLGSHDEHEDSNTGATWRDAG